MGLMYAYVSPKFHFKTFKRYEIIFIKRVSYWWNMEWGEIEASIWEAAGSLSLQVTDVLKTLKECLIQSWNIHISSKTFSRFPTLYKGF